MQRFSETRFKPIRLRVRPLRIVEDAKVLNPLDVSELLFQLTDKFVPGRKDARLQD